MAANATPSNVTPKGPAPLLPLAAKSLGFNSVATSYYVYDVDAAGHSRRSGSLRGDAAGADHAGAAHRHRAS